MTRRDTKNGNVSGCGQRAVHASSRPSHDAPVLDWPGTEYRIARASRRSVLATLTAAIGGAFGSAAATAGAGATTPESWVKPRGTAAIGALTFVRVHADADGRTRIEQREIPLSEAPARGLFEQPAETFAIRVIPPGMFFDWHKPSRRRMIGVLRGSATMTLRDGTSAKAVPGMVLLVENTRGEGHRGNFDESEFTITFDVGLAG